MDFFWALWIINTSSFAIWEKLYHTLQKTIFYYNWETNVSLLKLSDLQETFVLEALQPYMKFSGSLEKSH